MSDARTFVQFGAGNIGRSFVAQLFAGAGFEVVFVDVVPEIIEAINSEGRYCIEVRDTSPETIWVEGVRAVDGRDTQAVAQELVRCELCATAVGPNALSAVQKPIARALELRRATGGSPLDIILCENLRDAGAFMREGLARLLPAGFPLSDAVGLVETSIGKMVPIMPEEVRAQDPLLVYAEAYNTLICDRLGFRNSIPEVPGLDPKENMTAYVDRKSFVHNFGHALCAYFAHLEAPELTYTWEAVSHPTVGPATREGMWESARALIAHYPEEFSDAHMAAHIDDLLGRFCNQALGDTIYRVGRDVTRKLGREDRVIGPLLLESAHGRPGATTALCAAAGMRFLATDEGGEPYPADVAFAQNVFVHGPDHVLRTICGLDPACEFDRAAYDTVLEAADRLAHGLGSGSSLFS